MTRPSRRVRQLLPINVDYQSEAGVDNGADGIDWDTGDYTPILTPFGVPAINYGTPAAGTDLTAIRTDATITPPDLDDLGGVNAPTPSDQDVLTWDAGAAEWIAQAAPGAGGGDSSGQLIVGFDGGGSPITAGARADIIAPFTGTLTDWTLLADTTGSAVVDIWLDTYANFPPTVADTITAAAKPTLTTAIKATSSTLTGWTTAVTAGDILRFNLDSASTVTRLLLVVAYSRP